jgi:hypothetical protein
MACLEWLAMAEVNFSLTQLVSQHFVKSRLSWIRHASFSKKARRKKEDKIKI